MMKDYELDELMHQVQWEFTGMPEALPLMGMVASLRSDNLSAGQRQIRLNLIHAALAGGLQGGAPEGDPPPPAPPPVPPAPDPEIERIKAENATMKAKQDAAAKAEADAKAADEAAAKKAADEKRVKDGEARKLIEEKDSELAKVKAENERLIGAERARADRLYAALSESAQKRLSVVKDVLPVDKWVALLEAETGAMPPPAPKPGAPAGSPPAPVVTVKGGELMAETVELLHRRGQSHIIDALKEKDVRRDPITGAVVARITTQQWIEHSRKQTDKTALAAKRAGT